MNEEHLIKFLSEESDKIGSDATESSYNFDIGLCGWKDVKEDSVRKNTTLEAPKFRIRVVETRGSLTRSASSTVSSSNDSRSSSPNSDIGHYTIRNKGMKNLNKRRLTSSACKNEETPVVFEDIKPTLNIIRIHKMSNPQRLRKPIKVFRLPRVEQGEEE
ncbi:hypothetical protein SteCoe_33136 [Stentor coeruleus]|uniref:Uncharacterized protein n=1 Tax=Stentor coeruleus TaxID=5963 RepID=A0A1R2AXG8_9CILI|nr:hypothetical protein SteCoe_33136 [Stentor coeruleus]